MQAMRYKEKVLEKLENNERLPLTEKIRESNVAKELWEVLEKEEIVYLWNCCDKEFVDKHKDLFYK